MITAVVDRVSRSTALLFAVSWIALSLASIAWGMATPLSGTPDEPSHIIKAASVVRGQFIGREGPDPSRTLVDIPVGLAGAWNWACFAHDETISAACIPPVTNGLQLTQAETSAGLYNPVYYAVVGLPSLVIADTVVDVYAMRALSAILVSAFLALSFTLLMRLIPSWAAGLAFFGAVTPMVLFLGGAINPNGLEIAAAISLTVSLLYVCIGTDRSHERLVLAGVAASAVFLANARGISPLWMAVIGIVVLIVTPGSRLLEIVRSRRGMVTLAVMALGVAFALVWLLSTGSLGSLGVFEGANDTTPAEAFFVMLLLRTADPGIIALFGWVDTFAPSIVYVIWSALLGAGLIFGLVAARGRWLIGFLFALAAALLAPAAVQATSITTTGYIWQGRYSIAIIAVALVVAAVAATQRSLARPVPRAFVRLSSIVGVLVVGGQLISLVAAVLRYASPHSSSPLALLRGGEWSPPGTGALWLVLLAISLALLVALWIVSVRREVAATMTEPALD